MENLVKERGTKRGDKNLKKSKQSIVKSNSNATRAKTVAPNNDCGEADPSIKEKSSNVGQGPAIESL